jgi:thiol-disulfide isomerase/thioredoxin
MLSLTLGPLAFPLPPLMVLLALLLATVLTRRVAPPEARDGAETSLWLAAAVGLLAARAGHVLGHAEAYAATPLAVLDLRDGGWFAPAGLLAAAGMLALGARRRPAQRRALIAGGGGGVVLWAALAFGLPLAAPGPGATQLPALVLQPLDGGPPKTLTDLADGGPAVINLWATWCGPCREEMPVLAAAQQRHRGVRFLFLNQGEDPAAVQRYLQREGLALEQVWLDPASAAGPAFGSRGLPTTLFFDATGRRVDAHFGVLNAAALQARLTSLGWARP